MSKAFKLLLVLCLPLTGFTQNPDSAQWSRFTNLYDNPYKKFEAAKIIGVQFKGDLSGHNISNDFIYPFVFGKKLEKPVLINS